MNRGIFFLLLAIPAIAPLGSGSLEAWVAPIVAGLSFFVLIWIHFEVRRKGFKYFQAPGISLWVFLCGFVGFQLIPLPPWLLKYLSSHTYGLYEQTVWVVSPGHWMSLSVIPKETLGAFFHFSAMGALYVSAVQVLSHRDDQKKTIFFLCLLCGIYALLGFLSESGLGMIGAGSPILIPEILAALALFLPLSISCFLANKPGVQYQSFSEQLLEFSKDPETKKLLMTGLVVILLVSVILLRGPLFVSVASLSVVLFLGFAFSLRTPSRKRGITVILATLLVMLGLGILKGDEIKDSLTSRQVVGFGFRTNGLANIALFKNFPFTGSGLGSFSSVASGRLGEFPEISSRPEPISDVFTLLIESGLVGSALWGGFALIILKSVWGAWRTRRSSTSIYLSMGAMAGLLSGIVLSVFGGCLSSLGGSTLWAFLAAVAVTASHSKSRGQGQASELTKTAAPRIVWTFGIFILLLCGGLFFHFGNLGAQLYLPPQAEREVWQDGSHRELIEEVEPLLIAAQLAPLEKEYPQELGKILSSAEHRSEALVQYIKALRLAPLSGAISHDLGLLLAASGDEQGAEKLLFAAANNNYWTIDYHLTLAHWLFARRHNREGLNQISQAISIAPAKTGELLALMSLYGFSSENMETALPPEALAQVIYGEHLVQEGHRHTAERIFKQALSLARQSDKNEEDTFLRLFKYYANQLRYEEALAVAQAGLEVAPENTALLRSTAMAYESMGVTYRALEEYRKAIVLDPDDEQSRLRIKQLSNP